MVVVWVIGKEYDTSFMHKNAIVVDPQLKLGLGFCDTLQCVIYSIMSSIAK